MTAVLALAERHRVEQARGAEVVRALTEALFWRLVDPADLDGSFTRLQGAALPVLAQGRKRAAAQALAFYSDARAAAGHGPGTPALVVPGLDVAAATVSTRVTGPVAAKAALARGASMDDALRAAAFAFTGYAVRATLAGGRDTVIAAAREDPTARGWARVSDGAPCSFCAMLTSRGPVYATERTARFRAHDRCGCGVRPWFEGEGDGWDPDALAYRRLYEDDPDWTPQGGRSKPGTALAPADFRRAVREATADPTHPVGAAVLEKVRATS